MPDLIDIVELIEKANSLGVKISFDNDDLVVQVHKENKVDPLFFSTLRANKSVLKAYFNKYRQNQQEKEVNNAIRVFDKGENDRVHLSFSQERLWFIDKLQGSRHYHIPLMLRLFGPVNVLALEASFRDIINRHEVLRTVMHEEEGKAYQVVSTASNWQLQYINDKDLYNNNHALLDYVEGLKEIPFNLSCDSMLRAWLIKVSAKEHALIIIVHHIAADGWSVKILKNELSELYRSRLEGRTPLLRTLPVQYADYARWQRQYLSGEALTAKLDYWKKKLHGVQPLDFPADFIRSAEQSIRGQLVEKVVSGEIADGFRALCQRQGVTLFMALLSAFKVLLYRYTGTRDICVGTPIAGRQHQEVEGLIGFFINTLALRSEIDGNMSFVELLQQVKETTMEAYEHQEVPFEKVVEALELPRDISRTPVFQFMFGLENMEEKAVLGGAALTETGFLKMPAKFDVSLQLLEASDGLHMLLIYCTDLYRHDTAVQLVNDYERLLRAILADENTQLKTLNLLNTAEEQQLLAFNDTTGNAPAEKTIVDCFEQQVAATPDAEAVLFGEHRITYAQLNERANRLAHYLRNRGVGEETLVPLCIDRSLEMIIGILGILKAGGAWVPVDPACAEDQIRFMITDTRATILLTTSEHKSKMPSEIACSFVMLDSDWEKISKEAATKPENNLAGQHVAYVLYSSEIADKPIGIMTAHTAIVNRLLWQQRYVPVTAKDAVLQKAACCFGVSMIELFWPLLAGAKLFLAQPGKQHDTGYLKQIIDEQNITTVYFTPATLEQFLLALQAGDCTGIKNVFCSGDFLKLPLAHLFKEKLPHAALHYSHDYAEATTGVTYYAVPELIKNTILPAGKPVPNTSLYLLDKANNLAPLGSIGELYVGGIQVAQGYLNQPALTTGKFVPDPFSKKAGMRMYRTGHLAKWLPDGNLAWAAGDNDRVKLHGYWVQIQEIEAVLQQAPGVGQAVVLATGDQQNRQLAGYIVPVNGFDKEAVLQYMSARLPEYMVTHQLFEIKCIPLTSEGRIDRSELERTAFPIATSSTDNAMPDDQRNALEKELVLIWKDLLGVKAIGINDNFFELGGDSIITIQLVNRVWRLGYELQPRDIFAQQTIARLCSLLLHRKMALTAGEQEMVEGQCGLLPIQHRFFERASAAPSHYNQSVLLGISKDISAASLETCIKQLIAQHDSLRFIYRQIGNEWQQWYSAVEGRIEVEDFRSCSRELIKTRITGCADSWQHSLDITRGELMRVVLMQTPDFEEQNRLLFIVHHLAVDGISWRILLAELEILLSAIQQNIPVNLGKKTSSYRQWYEGLVTYAQHPQLLSQIKYWENIVSVNCSLPVDNSYEGQVRWKDMQQLSMKLSIDKTRSLLQKVPAVYQTEINDLLLAALGKALQGWSGTDKVIIGLESHGREDTVTGIDTTRSVGWFTCTYPVLLELDQKATPGDLIKHVKEQLRSIPDKGLGYGVLKYINRLPLLKGIDPWQIVFNYLGQIDNVVGKNNGFKAVREHMGTQINKEITWNDRLEINCIVMAGELVMRWMYSSRHYQASTIEKLGKQYIAALDELIMHCINL